jgi:hypothetical protein
MNITAININPKSAVTQISNSKNSNKQYISIPSYSLDSNNKKVASINPTFEGFFSNNSNVAFLNTREGLLKMQDHFSVLKNHDPSHAHQIDLIKNFCLGVNDEVRIMSGKALKLNNRPWETSEAMSLDNTIYEFGDASEHNSNYTIGGKGNHLGNFIEKLLQLETKSIKEMKADDDSLSFCAGSFREIYPEEKFVDTAKIFFGTTIIQKNHSFNLFDVKEEFNARLRALINRAYDKAGL